MYCPNCGRKIPDDSAFCPECGAKIELVEENAEYNPIEKEDDSFYEKEPSSKGPVAAVIIIAAAAVVAVFLILNRANLPIPLPGQNTSSEAAAQLSEKESIATGQATVTPTPASGNEKKPSSRVTVTPTPTAKPKPTVTQAPTVITPTPTTDPLDGIKDGDYIFPDSDTVPLTESNLEGLSAWELTIARNEIVARHGWIFNRTDLQDYFNQKSWYHPVAQFDLDTVLSKTELNNMTLIQKYQDEHGLQTHG